MALRMPKLLTLTVVFSMALIAEAQQDFHRRTAELKEAGEIIEKSYQSISPEFTGLLTSPVGNTLRYVAEAIEIVAPGTSIDPMEFVQRFSLEFSRFPQTQASEYGQVAYFEGRGRCLVSLVGKRNEPSMALEVLFSIRDLCAEVGQIRGIFSASERDFVIIVADLSRGQRVTRVRASVIAGDRPTQIVEVPTEFLSKQ